MQIFLLF